jgi:phage gp36-like protein
MSAYCTKQDLVDRIGAALLLELSDLDGTGEIDDARVAQVIEAASAEIDTYAQDRYGSPLDPVPVIVRSHTADIAVYLLMVARGYDQALADGIWAQRYKRIMDWARDLSRGDATPGAPVPSEQGTLPAFVSTPERIFNRDTLKGF